MHWSNIISKFGTFPCREFNLVISWTFISFFFSLVYIYKNYYQILIIDFIQVWMWDQIFSAFWLHVVTYTMGWVNSSVSSKKLARSKKSDDDEEHILGFTVGGLCCFFLVNNLKTLFLICSSHIAVRRIGNPLRQNRVIEPSGKHCSTQLTI